MTRNLCAAAGAVLLGAAAHGGGAAAVSPTTAPINWQAFLARSDLVWDKLPAAWEEAPFIGNGNLGATIYLHGAGLGWEVNRADVYHDGSRYPMGQMAVQVNGGISAGSARLDLWNAEVRGTLQTKRGIINWRSFAATSPSVIVLEWEGTLAEAANTDVVWLPVLARPPRKVEALSRPRRPNAPPPEPLSLEDLHPPPNIVNSPGLVTGTQRFNGGGAFAVALLRDPIAPRRKHRYYLSVGFGATDAVALAEATASVQRASAIGFDALVAAHRAWWRAYYPASFLSVPDPRLEAFYWIQMYKLGSAMRPDGPILDLMGPWFRHTPWPRIWWNLNAQLTYSPIFGANRLPLGASLFNSLDRHRQQLIDNVAEDIRGDAAAIGRTSDQSLVSKVDLATARSDEGREAGNLPWVTYLYWEYYRYQMDDSILRDRVLPLLSRAMGYYLANLQKGADGTYHLRPTFSPELATVPDANYDLALLRWGLGTLVSACDRLSLDDPRLPQWRDVLAHLAPFPTDATGLLVGSGYPLTVSHRHYSHLLAIYPLHLITPDRPEDRKLIETSLHTWASRPEKFRGFSYTGAASIYALLGDGTHADAELHTLIDPRPRSGGWTLQPNTFYTEGGPVIETPLSAATSLQEMLLQSWGGTLRVFPAVPAAWSDSAFSNLRGEGAFLVSAARSGGKTAWVRIQSLAGEPCRVKVADWGSAVVRTASADAPPDIESSKAGTFTVSVPKGGWVVLAPAADSALVRLAPVPEPRNLANPFGLRAPPPSGDEKSDYSRE